MNKDRFSEVKDDISSENNFNCPLALHRDTSEHNWNSQMDLRERQHNKH